MNLEKLKNINNIIVIGHKNPDTDSCLSSVLVTNILNNMNIKTSYAIWEDDILSNQTKKMIDDITSYKPIILKRKDINKYHYFLVDHNDIKQSINNENLVIGIIDHHPKCNKLNNSIIKNLVSTSIVIYDSFKDIYNFNKEEINMILMSTIDDSAFGYSSRYNKKSKELLSSISKNIDFTKYFNKYFTETDITNLPKTFTSARYKKYKFNHIEFESTGLEMLSDDYLDKYKKFILNNKHNFLGIYINYKDKKTYAYFKYNNKFYEKKYNIIASRGSLIIKDILKLIESEKEND